MAAARQQTRLLFGRLFAIASCVLHVLAAASALAQDESSPPQALLPPSTEASPRLVRLAGSPEEIGEQHGRLLASQIGVMIQEYVGDDTEFGKLNEKMQARVQAMKPSLPEWYMRELRACAAAAGIDEDVLLYAQCEGDIKSLTGCTSFVAFGPATHDGAMEMGRNFDYWGLVSTERCVKIFATVPRREDGYAFVSVGWAGILGGWTFFNEKGVYVSNNLSWSAKTNPKGIPTLILERVIAQRAASVDEAVAIVRNSPRMRGQALVIGQTGDPARGIRPDAAVIIYTGGNAENAAESSPHSLWIGRSRPFRFMISRSCWPLEMKEHAAKPPLADAHEAADASQGSVRVEKATDGFAFHSSIGANKDRLLELLKQADRRPPDVIRSAGSFITLHSVAIRPQEQALWVAHGRKPSAHEGEYVKYDLRELLGRRE
jgi:hypothetical protein